MTALDPEILLLGLICGLLVVPRALQRFRIPAPLTCLVLGIAASFVAAQYKSDVTLGLLATLGISSLFLYAGLEVDLPGLRRSIVILSGHLVFRALSVGVLAWAATHFLKMSWPEAILLALAILTPSTGFILDSLSRLGLDDDERFWVTNKAVAGELLALAALFAVLQSDSTERLAMASGALVALIASLPLAYLLLGRLVVKHAPGSEFSLLVMVGMVAAYVTKLLGAYYLVGAFLAGLAARLMRRAMPDLSSDANQHAVKVFASFFLPFYFFTSGMKVTADALSWDALAIGLSISALFLPARIGAVWLQRRIFLHESKESSLRVSIALAPTLIFTLVLAAILRDRYNVDPSLYGGLLVYAAISTALPSFVLKGQADFGLLLDDEVGPPEPPPATKAEGKAASTPVEPPEAVGPPATPARPAE
jgi:Kef-type K+ transport system membrane component KefB